MMPANVSPFGDSLDALPEDFEAQRTREALAQWCADNGLNLVD
jgi:hypothetical protein